MVSTEGPFKIEFPGARLYKKIAHVRTLSGKDIRRFSAAIRTGAFMKVYEIFGSTLEGINYKELTMHDWWYLLLWHRLNSYGNYFPIEISWTCKHCGNKNVSRVTANMFKIKEIDPEYRHGIKVFFPGIKKALTLRIQLVADDIGANEYCATILGVTNPDPEVLEPVLMAHMIMDDDLLLEEKIKLVESFSVDDYFQFKAFEEYYSYGVQNEIPIPCNSCSKVSDVQYSFNVAEFFPRNFDRERLRDIFSPGYDPAPANRPNGEFRPGQDVVDAGSVSGGHGVGEKKEEIVSFDYKRGVQ